MARSRSWTFTLNNYTAEQEAILKSEEFRRTISYIVYEKEIAPTTGTPHIQGYIHLKNAVTLKNLRKHISETGHFEIAKGSPEQNKAYCTKDKNDVTEWGELPKPGHRTDLEQTRELLKQGGMAAVCESAPSYQSLKSAEILMKYQRPPKREPPIVLWFWGPTGTGKTRKAVDMGGDDYWISSRDLRWWDGYCGQKTVILDDIRPKETPFNTLLRYLDRYPVRVELKGSSTWLIATTIIVTSSQPPEVFGAGCLEDVRQLKRRISETTKFEEIEKFSTEVEGNTCSSTSNT